MTIEMKYDYFKKQYKVEYEDKKGKITKDYFDTEIEANKFFGGKWCESKR